MLFHNDRPGSRFLWTIAARILRSFFLLAAVPAGLAAAPAQLDAIIIKEHPHDPAAFTQGLAWDQGAAYESTGLYGRSSLRRVDIESGRVVQQRDFGRQFFAEGLTVFGDSIYQLTWKNQLIFQHDKASLALRRSFPWHREGWGITHDGSSLIVSDGSSSLYFLDSGTMVERRRLTVHDGDREIDRLNELEYVNGSIYANIWQECRVAVISAADGAVTAWIDLSKLCAQMRRGTEDVLNGIMHNPATDSLFVTGKLWPALFEIKVEAKR